MSKTHAMFGMAQIGYTLTDIQVEKTPDTDGCYMTNMTFIDAYDNAKEIVIKTNDKESAERVKKGMKSLSNMDYLSNSDVEVDFDKEYYYGKVYNARTDQTYQKILRLNGNRFCCMREEEVLCCKPIPDSLYREAVIANDINEASNAPLSMKFFLDYDNIEEVV